MRVLNAFPINQNSDITELKHVPLIYDKLRGEKKRERNIINDDKKS